MFPLKTLVLAATIAIAFSPRVDACAMHKHAQTVAAPPAGEKVPATASTTSQPSKDAAAETQTTDVASTQPKAPAAN